MITFIVATRNVHKLGEIRAVLGVGARCLSLADLPPAPDVVEDAQTFAGNALKKALALASWLRRHRTPAFVSGVTFVMADDSGLEVDALDGDPGVRSARYASESGDGNAPDALNNAKLLAALKSVQASGRTARFRCAIAVVPVVDSPEFPHEPGGAGALTSPYLVPREHGHPGADSSARQRHASPLDDASSQCGLGTGLEALQEHADRGERVFEGKCEGSIAMTLSGSGGFGYDPLFIPSGFTLSFAELGEEVKNRISHRARALDLVKEHLTALRARAS